MRRAPLAWLSPSCEFQFETPLAPLEVREQLEAYAAAQVGQGRWRPPLRGLVLLDRFELRREPAPHMRQMIAAPLLRGRVEAAGGGSTIAVEVVGEPGGVVMWGAVSILCALAAAWSVAAGGGALGGLLLAWLAVTAMQAIAAARGRGAAAAEVAALRGALAGG